MSTAPYRKEMYLPSFSPRPSDERASAGQTLWTNPSPACSIQRPWSRNRRTTVRQRCLKRWEYDVSEEAAKYTTVLIGAPTRSEPCTRSVLGRWLPLASDRDRDPPKWPKADKSNSAAKVTNTVENQIGCSHPGTATKRLLCKRVFTTCSQLRITCSLRTALEYYWQDLAEPKQHAGHERSYQ